MTAQTAEKATGGKHRTLVMALRMRWHAVVRHRIRDDELGLLLLAILVGVGVGIGVAIVRGLNLELHHFLFGIDVEEHLSSAVPIAPLAIILVPSLGGLAYGYIAAQLRRWRPRDIVDAVEANALYGGRMSLSDSLRLTFLTVLSAGCGASVGLEAAYTQLGSGAASWLGATLHLRRTDLRTMVGCGAAAAIAAAFNAPLAGAFYAFELIIGSYTLMALAPVAIAALAGALVERIIFGSEPIYALYDPVTLAASDYVVLVLLGIGAAFLAITTMVGVTIVESWGRRIAIPAAFRPAIGGFLLGLIALIYPEVLGSGHGGIDSTMGGIFPVPVLLGLIVAKLVASAVSIGSGFRGGMFSSSLFLGSLFGSAVASAAASIAPGFATHATVLVLAGMGAVAAGVVGAPVTMILLVLEATSDFAATIGVTCSVILASFCVRRWFGYSFATWRFHVRGVALRGGHDIGWLQDLSVGRVMHQDFATVAAETPIRDLCGRFPVSAAKIVFLTDADGRYAGTVDTQEAHSLDHDGPAGERPAAEIAHAPAHFLTPTQTVRAALDLFVTARAEMLAVVDSTPSRRVVGYLTEAFALRRYNRELEARRVEEIGDEELFARTRAPGDSAAR